MLPVKSNKTKSNLDTVTRYILKQDVVLTSEQEELMQRIMFVDDKIRSRKFLRDQIINMVVARYSVSPWRAEQDIVDTHKLFGATRKINKNYLIAQHLDEIQSQIQLAKDLRRIDLLPKLNDAFTYALNSIPAEAKENDTPITKVIFVNNASKPESGKTIEELIAEADAMIKNTKVTDDEYLEYDDGEGDNL